MDWSAPNVPVTKPNASLRTKSPPLKTSSGFGPQLQYELTRLDQSVPFRPLRRYLHHTWAQTFFSRPEFYFQPESIPELQKIVTLARRCRKRICVTGYGHSPSILTCTSSWLVNLDKISRIIDIDVNGKPGHVRFEAGISLHDLNQGLAEHGYTLPNLGSIDVQALAGAISTGTHGSSLHHGLLSQAITSLTVMLSSSQLVTCSAQKNPDLFRAALLSLGSLGIIVEMTFQAVPDFNISWMQTLQPISEVLSTWPTTLWTTEEYTRVWWLPYLKRAVVWRAHQTDEPARPPSGSFYGGKLGYYVYHNLLALSNYVPRILPWVEWFVFGMQYGFKPGSVSQTAIEPAREGLLMNCLYSQFVNEWAIPLSRGPEAIERLSAWINHEPSSVSRIPFSNQGLWVHCPIEVRVSDTSLTSSTNTSNASGIRPYLDPTTDDGPTLYLNATLYRPYGRDPPCHLRYYEAFEWLMKEMGGRPHWAKNFAYTDKNDLEAMYGSDMKAFMKVRDEADPEGMFIGEWHCQNLPVSANLLRSTGSPNLKGTEKSRKSLVEGEIRRKKMGLGWGDGVLWEGAKLVDENESMYTDDGSGDVPGSIDQDLMSMSSSRFETISRTSEESFDLMSKGEASVYMK